MVTNQGGSLAGRIMATLHESKFVENIAGFDGGAIFIWVIAEMPAWDCVWQQHVGLLALTNHSGNCAACEIIYALTVWQIHQEPHCFHCCAPALWYQVRSWNIMQSCSD